MIMVAVPVGRESQSLIESIVAAIATRRARSGKAQTPSGVGWWLGELLGTLAALGAFTVGAFLYAAPIVAWIVLGVALLLLDTKVSAARRERRRVLAASVVAPVSSSRFVRE